MNYPTRDHWFDFVWPSPGAEGDRILVMVQEDTDIEEVAKAAAEDLGTTYMLLVEDFDLFNREIPDSWRRMPPTGGFPFNVWVGAAFVTIDEADERASRLLKIRARRLFLVAKKGHETLSELSRNMEPWRCMHCGRRGFTEVPERCPTGSICAGMEHLILPQITWLVDMDRDKESEMRQVCAFYQVALWDGVVREVPR